MYIRKATVQDVAQLKSLYQGVIRAVNSRDYNEAQVAVWAARGERTESLIRRIHEQHFFVTETPDRIITGFASIDNTGELDMLFVHKDYQRRGIATLLMQQILAVARQLQLPTLTSYVSITAKPFFEKMGFRVITPQTMELDGVEISNFEMQKHLVI
ncbi:GNAT family N-acetyltransferase [Chitinophaga sp. Mgbs1]|uniref:GNAT family N-acetyltransferase n=1 Tax=Chitinophaga solisilvae TaxID=1233460 RepID=A0A3S1CNH7_9BACT|nr:GNAT family N-acetyltransferase [Chitinophaga solisilvae]